MRPRQGTVTATAATRPQGPDLTTVFYHHRQPLSHQHSNPPLPSTPGHARRARHGLGGIFHGRVRAVTRGQRLLVLYQTARGRYHALDLSKQQEWEVVGGERREQHRRESGSYLLLSGGRAPNEGRAGMAILGRRGLAGRHEHDLHQGTFSCATLPSYSFTIPGPLELLRRTTCSFPTDLGSPDRQVSTFTSLHVAPY